MPLRALAALVTGLAGASGCGDEGAVPEDARAAMPLRAIARGEESLRGISSAGIAVRSGRYVTVIGARRSTVTIAGSSALLLPDLDGDRQPEVAASLGPELRRQLAVELSTGGRVVVSRRGWDVLDVRGTIGGRWLVVAYGRGGTWLLGYAPREQRWVWKVRAADEVDDVDVRGDRVRVAGYSAPSSRSVVLDIVVRGDDAQIANREVRPVNVRTSDARIEPAWRLEEVNEPRYAGDSPHGRVELTRPDGAGQRKQRRPAGERSAARRTGLRGRRAVSQHGQDHGQRDRRGWRAARDPGPASPRPERGRTARPAHARVARRTQGHDDPPAATRPGHRALRLTVTASSTRCSLDPFSRPCAATAARPAAAAPPARRSLRPPLPAALRDAAGLSRRRARPRPSA
jgi:hypothetical protein